MGSSSEQRNKMRSKKPLGIQLFENVRGSPLSFRSCQALVLVLTFLSYASYHATRKTTSIVKSVLDPKTNLGMLHWPSHLYLEKLKGAENNMTLSSGWAPFNDEDGTALLGEIDLAFLGVYSFGMFFAGHLGDRVDLRILLTIGMIGTGLFTAAFGAGYWFNIHNFYYFLGMQMIAGLFQSSGWPSVVAVIGNWFGKSKRGLIMGIWNAHTSVGNISGSLIAAAMLKFGWSWSFAVPGIMISLVGLTVFLFLPVSPDVIGIELDLHLKDTEKNDMDAPLLEGRLDVKEKAVGFIEAWIIPGVAPFALCLFFCKLVAYTFLYWLPFYISHTAIGGQYLSDSSAGVLSTLFDVGGVVGGILAGHISDHLDARALTAASFTFSAIPALFFYRIYGSVSLIWNIALMFVTGMLVNGPYALITTAVSADLGTHSSLNGNSRALATVTAIIDGTGSIGAAVGPLLTGYISAKSWSAVFTMLMASALVAGLLLSRLVVAEVVAKMEPRRPAPASDLPVSSMDEP
ncbi:putative glycerol-3-phosphate transporter 1 [Phragmites australis]|uniref:putative glycerol-3-phosphate transporter 1 n=1 Tax=Phragmites australis TaxID=29695 RepID=UPI002D7822E7|nr:putative glycerol-3-phosphate transporter 1 [Phragmites australis]XP_062226375.1 putative glycerol-3-phosphate transporter 1 [Phragmites australis]XP_062226376.1 putative glycerol-3-phosphate transporter 1 [Phragmites australis]